MWAVTSRAVLVLLAACSDPAAHVSLVPIDYGREPRCGQPNTAMPPVSEVRVTAYGPTGDTRRTDGVIEDFPAPPEQLGVEVFGGAVVLAAAAARAAVLTAAGDEQARRVEPEHRLLVARLDEHRVRERHLRRIEHRERGAAPHDDPAVGELRGGRADERRRGLGERHR